MREAKFKGDEFELGEIAMLEGGGPVRVIAFTEVGGGWWFVEFKNGSYDFTQSLTKMLNSEQEVA